MADEKKTVGDKKSPNNLTPFGDDNNPKKKPKFNIYWIYGIAFAALIGYQLFYKGAASGGVETNQIKFKEMVRNGDVEKIKTVRNKKIVRVYLKKEALTSHANYYRNILEPSQYDLALRMPPPQLYFSIIEDKTFSEEMRAFYKENPTVAEVPDSPDDEGELFGQIISSLLPILLIGLLFVMMMRKVGGPAGSGGGPGGIFNIGKSKATLFDKA